MNTVNSVKAQLAVMLDMTEAESEKYDGCINSSVEYVQSMLINQEDCNDNRVINLCAVLCALKIALIKDAVDSDVTSFSAGDVSYKRSNTSAEKFTQLYEQSFSECAGLIKDSGFSFKAV